MLKKLIIIIPAFNEEETIFDLIENIPIIKEVNQEIIVIDDGSTDNTIIEAKRTSAHILANEKNLGLGNTFRKGVEEALKLGADYIVNIDADAQYDPKDIPILLNKLIENDVDLIVGNRFLDDRELGKNFIQRFGNKVLSIFISKVLLKQKEIIDIQSGFRLFNNQLAEFLVSRLKGKYTYTQEMMILTTLNKFKIRQIPIKFYARSSGKSRLIKNPFIYLFKIIFITMRTFIEEKSRN